MPAPVVFAARFTVLPEADELIDVPPSPLMLDESADAIKEVVVPDPLQLVESP